MKFINVLLSVGGLDQSTNIVVVCPNHHQILDGLGDEIEQRSDDSLTIRVEDKKYTIDI